MQELLNSFLMELIILYEELELLSAFSLVLVLFIQPLEELLLECALEQQVQQVLERKQLNL